MLLPLRNYHDKVTMICIMLNISFYNFQALKLKVHACVWSICLVITNAVSLNDHKTSLFVWHWSVFQLPPNWSRLLSFHIQIIQDGRRRQYNFLARHFLAIVKSKQFINNKPDHGMCCFTTNTTMELTNTFLQFAWEKRMFWKTWSAVIRKSFLKERVGGGHKFL